MMSTLILGLVAVAASVGFVIQFRKTRRHSAAAALLQAEAAEAAVQSKSQEAEILRSRRIQQDLQESEEFSRAVFEASQAGLLVVDPGTSQIMDANSAAAAVLGRDADDLIGACSTELLVLDPSELEPGGAPATPVEGELQTIDGRNLPVIRSVRHIAGDRNQLAVISFVDISRLKEAEAEIRESHAKIEQANEELKRHKDQIVQSEKLASIGQLAAGVAHEINNPVGFVTSNLGTVQEYFASLTEIIRLYTARDELGTTSGAQWDELTAAIAGTKEEEDLDFIFEDLESVINESLEGVGRVSEIVQNLKSFAREDTQQARAYDVNEGVEAMIKMSWNELKYRCEVEKDLGEVPKLACHGGQVNQVIMNMLVNAAQAMPEGGGTIRIATASEDDNVVVTIADNGSGIPEETLSRIFDPFFTTKDVGEGTGLGLSISHGIIQEAGGNIEVDSTVGEGTTFRILLPMAAAPTEELIG